jgi:hypothetical protein
MIARSELETKKAAWRITKRPWVSLVRTQQKACIGTVPDRPGLVKPKRKGPLVVQTGGPLGNS